MPLLGDLIIEDSPGFACSKSKLTEDGLIHLRPFNIGADGKLDSTQIYRVPATEAPAAKRALQAGDILFNNTNSVELVGKVAIVEQDTVAGFSNHLTRLRVDRSKIEPTYLLYFLRWLWQSGLFAAKATRWVSQAAFKSDQLRAITLSLPLLPEQRRIVDILSRADGIIRLQRQAAEKAREIIPALFLDMFGDPGTNPKGWPTVRLGDLLTEPPTLGTMTKPSSNEARWLDLRVANIQGGQLTLNDKKWVDLPPEHFNRFALRSGDVLLARAIGSLDHLGKAIVVYPDSDWTFDSHLMRVRVDPSRLLPEVLKGFLESNTGRLQFLKHTRRSAVQFNINGKELRAIQLPLSPLELQTEYLLRVTGVCSLQSQQSAAISKAKATFDAVLAQAFSG